jgi:hypothetical protein
MPAILLARALDDPGVFGRAIAKLRARLQISWHCLPLLLMRRVRDLTGAARSHFSPRIVFAS